MKHQTRQGIGRNALRSGAARLLSKQLLSRQNGAALFISLMFLILLTLLGLSAANVGILQERMSGNVRESNIAFQTAEAALRGIERRVQAIALGGGGGLGDIPNWNDFQTDFGVARGDCSLSMIEQGDSFDTLTWQTSPDVPEAEYVITELSGGFSGGLVVGSACRPLHSEDSGKPGAGVYFMIMARAAGPAGTANAVVQSIYFWPI
ncbi:MAG: PilX N-terminal domain-containing pilus assembly protein [Wenzhouxiangellaceae bacterium]